MAERQPRLTAAAKSWLRSLLRSRRRRVSSVERTRAGRRAAILLSRVPEFRRARTVAVFVGFGREIDTRPLLALCWRSGKTVVAPRTNRGLHRSYFAVIEPHHSLTPTAFGPHEHASNTVINESTIDLMLVPGLGFSSDGHRIGYGGGVYDRFIAGSPRAFHLGLGFSFQTLRRVPRASHDAAIDGLLTERSFLRFDGALRRGKRRKFAMISRRKIAP